MAHSASKRTDPIRAHVLEAQLAETEARLDAQMARLHAVNEELEQATAALWDQSARLRTILNTISIGVVVVRNDGRIEGANRAAERLFGIVETQLIGKALSEGLRFETVPFQATLDIAAKTPIEARITHSEGRVFAIEVTAKKLPGVNHDSIVLILRDQTEAKRAEAERAELERELAQSQKLESLGTLAGGIAHEINTPIQYVGDNIRFLHQSFEDLRAVLDTAASLVTHAEADHTTRAAVAPLKAVLETCDLEFLLTEFPQAAEEAAEGVRRVSEIVRAIKEFSHPGQLEHAAVDLNHAIETTAIITRNQWKYVAELETRLDPNLPSVPCHPGEINQVIFNLIVNAADALGEICSEDSKGVITITSASSGDWVEVRVSDNGPGVPEALRQKIFDPFFTTKDPGKGTGQGLAICHSIIVKKHGGTLSIDPDAGPGACFVIRLPLGVNCTDPESPS